MDEIFLKSSLISFKSLDEISIPAQQNLRGPRAIALVMAKSIGSVKRKAPLCGYLVMKKHYSIKKEIFKS